MDDTIIKKLLKEVVTQLNWEDSNLWSTHDFEELSEIIFKKTTVTLSVTTLKRLWGKINYNSKPTITTLNTLSQFVGYKNWREYKQSRKKKPIKEKQEEVIIIEKPKKNTGFRKWFFISIPLVLALFYYYSSLYTSSTKKRLDPSNYSFTSKKILLKGVPNSVVFNYDALAASLDDTIHIQQSWDKQLRTVVERDNTIHKSMYYYPGYFIAKLVVAGSIIKEQGILIKSDGWLTVVDGEITKPPIYFKKEDAFTIDGVMTLPMSKILKKNISIEPTPIWVSHFYIDDFENVFSDNFVFETEVRNDYMDVAGICQYTQVFLYFKGALLKIPLSSRGCISNLTLYDINGKMDVDTSDLGFEPGSWVKIKVEVIEGNGKIYINEEYEYAIDFKSDRSLKFLGIHYNFEGAGSVKRTKVSGLDGEIAIDEVY